MEKRMTIKQLKELARDCCGLLGVVECASSSARRHILEAQSLARKEEKQHIAFGRRLVGKVRLRASITDTADIFVARAFVEQLATSENLVGPGLRSDYLHAYLAAQDIQGQTKRRADQGQAWEQAASIEAAVERTNLRARLESWDYSRDVAGND